MSPTDNTQLIQFLASQARPEGTLNYHQLHGFLFAITCSPELIKPSEWIPLIFNEQEAQYATMEEAQSITQAFMTLYNDINAQVFEGNVTLPDDINVKKTVLDNVGEDTPLGQWSSGFYMGHNWLVELWNDYTPDALDDELGGSLMVLSLFSSRTLADTFYQEIAASNGQSFEEYVNRMLKMFEDAMRSYAHLGRSIQAALTEQIPTQHPVTHEQKIGRNDPCPCGSGKKFKKCCLH